MPSAPPVFRHKGSRSRTEARKEYDQRRGSARERGYSARWDATARGYKRAHPLCLGCQAIGKVTATVLVDHVEPHRGDQQKFWDPTNWQPSCASHHDVVKQRLEVMFDQGKASVADLKLDSVKAIELTRQLLFPD